MANALLAIGRKIRRLSYMISAEHTPKRLRNMDRWIYQLIQAMNRRDKLLKFIADDKSSRWIGNRYR